MKKLHRLTNYSSYRLCIGGIYGQQICWKHPQYEGKYQYFT